MKPTLEEQIQYMRRHLNYCLEYPVANDGEVAAAILATLEAVRDTKVSIIYKDGEIVGIRKEQK